MKRVDYEIRRMTVEDLPAMRTIEEASFALPWPGTAYESELTTNRLARYVGAWREGELLGFGGIRIEDNIVLHANGVENMTRQAGL